MGTSKTNNTGELESDLGLTQPTTQIVNVTNNYFQNQNVDSDRAHVYGIRGGLDDEMMF